MKWIRRSFGAGWNSKFTRFLYLFLSPIYVPVCFEIRGFGRDSDVLNFLYLLFGFWIGDDDELMTIIFLEAELLLVRD